MNRLAALPVIGSIFLAACATTPNDVAGSSPAAVSAPPAALLAAASEPPADALVGADVVTVEMNELDSEVCESKRRPGSRITAIVCYTREELAALQKERAEAAQQYARDLDRERAMRDQQQRMGGAQRSPAIIVFQ
jgi:starvation-inducible outer membrane lipoprotein